MAAVDNEVVDETDEDVVQDEEDTMQDDDDDEDADDVDGLLLISEMLISARLLFLNLVAFHLDV